MDSTAFRRRRTTDSTGGLPIRKTRNTAADKSAPSAFDAPLADSLSLKFALAASELAANTRSENVVLLDLRARSPVTEYFIIATGTSPRQMRTVVDEIRDLGKKMGFRPWQMDGYESARWIVLDCVNVVIHLFDADSRDFYDLELLWGDCPRIDWRKALGLPPEKAVPRGRREDSLQERFASASGADQMDAEEEDARLDGRDLNAEEEGDADIDEDAEADAPIVMELPDLSTGSNSVEFVEIDPPAKRRQRGRAVYPTPIEEEEDTTAEERGMSPLRSSGQSLDEDDRQRAAESEADGDVEAVSKEDLPRSRQRRRPMGGVSASLSSTSINDPGEEDQLGSLQGSDAEQDHKDEIPEAHEAAAEAVRMGDVELTTEQPGQRPRNKVLRTRKDMSAPVQSAPGPVDIRKAKAGVVKPVKRAAPKAAKAKPRIAAKATARPVAKKAKAKPAAKKPAAKSGAKKAAAKKPAPTGKKKPR